MKLFLLPFFHIYTRLARTQNTLLKHITRVDDLTQGVGLGSLRERHLEHGFMDMRVELFSEHTILHMRLNHELSPSWCPEQREPYPVPFASSPDPGTETRESIDEMRIEAGLYRQPRLPLYQSAHLLRPCSGSHTRREDSYQSSGWSTVSHYSVSGEAAIHTFEHLFWQSSERFAFQQADEYSYPWGPSATEWTTNDNTTSFSLDSSCFLMEASWSSRLAPSACSSFLSSAGAAVSPEAAASSKRKREEWNALGRGTTFMQDTDLAGRTNLDWRIAKEAMRY